MNSVNLIGRLTKDPEVRYSAGNSMAVAKFTLAIDRMDKNKSTDFIPVTCFGATAEAVEKSLFKGKKAAVTGRIQTGSYEKDGRKFYTTDVIADRVEFLERKEKADDIEAKVPEGFSKIDNEDIPF